MNPESLNWKKDLKNLNKKSRNYPLPKQTISKPELRELEKQKSGLVITNDEANERSGRGESFGALVGDEGIAKDIIDIAPGLTAETATEGEVKLGTVELEAKGKSKIPVIRIEGVVHSGMASRFCEMLSSGDAKNAGDIEVRISTPGGSVAAGIQMYDEMVGHKANIHTVATGMVASMGTFR